MSNNYFFPCLGVDLKVDEPMIELGDLVIRRRLFPVSTFDLATLETRHRLHLPYQLMDIYLPNCKSELELRGANDFEEAADRMRMLRLLFYLEGIAPFLMPFCTTYSVNDYAGINSRDSETLRAKLAPEMQSGLTSEDATLEAWEVDTSLILLGVSQQTRELTRPMCEKVASQLAIWSGLETKYPVLRLVRRMANTAPMIPDVGSSILHMWQALESLFNVHGEIRFRLSLLISQLCALLETPPTMYKRAKAAYDVRSKIAHGASGAKEPTPQEWFTSWWILRTCLRAIIEREELPSEQNLFEELLSD